MLKYPIQPSNIAPSIRELEWLYEHVKKIKPKRILELGLGITTWVISQGTEDIESYLAIENIDSSLQSKYGRWDKYANKILELCPHVEVKDQWEYWGRTFDFILIDSSVGYPGPGLHRREALEVAEPHLEYGAHVVLHDWHTRSGKRVKDLVTTSKKYEITDETDQKPGIAIARRIDETGRTT